MDYKLADAIWKNVQEMISILDDNVEEFNDFEQGIVNQYNKAVDEGRVEFDLMYKLEADLEEALNYRKL